MGSSEEERVSSDNRKNLNVWVYGPEEGISETESFIVESTLTAVIGEEKVERFAIDSLLSLKEDYNPNGLPDMVMISNDLEEEEDDDSDDLEEEDVEVALPPRVLAIQDRSRRQTSRNLARFSPPSEERPVTEEAVEPLGNSPGPFSEALRSVGVRIEYRAVEELMTRWKNLVENRNHNVTPHFVPSLLDLSIKALAEYADRIVSLKLIPEFLRKRLTDVLCDTRRINARFLNLLAEGGPTQIRIKNCAWLTDEEFQESLRSWQTENLIVLQLDLGGQCMFDLAFRDKLARCSSSFSSLAILSLRGALRLSDSGVKLLASSAKALKSINLGQCSLLTSDAIKFIANSSRLDLLELYIDDCLKMNAKIILPSMKKFTNLEVLSVARIETVTDEFIIELVNVCGKSIKELDLANCVQITDLSLKTIAKSCSGLCSLDISHLLKLTDRGMEYLANGCRSIRNLKMSGCRFTDETLAAFVEASGECLVELLMNRVAEVGPNTAFSLAYRSRKLVCLDVSFCWRISDGALGLIVDACTSLKLLKIFGCRQITEVFLKGHSNPHVRVIGLNLGPMLDHLSLLEHGEVFLRYSALPNCGHS